MLQDQLKVLVIIYECEKQALLLLRLFYNDEELQSLHLNVSTSVISSENEI